MSTTTKYNEDTMTLERISARTFVILGGLFWVLAAFAAGRGLVSGSSIMSMDTALMPLVLTLAILAIGWFFEYVAAGILVAGSIGVLAWGITAGWEAGVWMLMASTLIAPMLISAMLFFLAARMQEACSLESLDIAPEVPGA
jgi:hypothetical protein